MHLVFVISTVLTSGTYGFSLYGSRIHILPHLQCTLNQGHLIRRKSKHICPIFNQELGTNEFLTEEDVEALNNYFKDIKDGVYGNELKEGFESFEENEVKRYDEQRMGDVDSKTIFNELINEKNKELDEKLTGVFNVANLPTSDEEVDWDDIERHLKEGKKGINLNELRSLVKSIYRKKGLISEPFKVCKFDEITLKWIQTLNDIDIWFSVDPSLTKKDFEITIMPSQVTILRRGQVILQKEMSGKVDCDGSFWTMYKNPSSDIKYININLIKRKPKYAQIWESLFAELQ